MVDLINTYKLQPWPGGHHNSAQREQVEEAHEYCDGKADGHDATQGSREPGQWGREEYHTQHGDHLDMVGLVSHR